MPDAHRTDSFWKRLTAGALVIVLATAAAAAALGFNELDRLAAAFAHGGTLGLGEELAVAEPSEPQTIMLIGSDERADGIETEPGELGDPRSDTVILVRLDPEKGATALLSLPRDLKVRIPGHGVGKLNDAYSFGGPRLSVKTVKELTGLQVNHVVDVDFGGFIKAVDALDCVYVDVDRDYFSAGTDFAYINLHAGYQRLCGDDALAYVRFRHQDTDLVRAARQHEFLRELKAQVTISEAISDRERLLDIFGRNAESTVDSSAETLTLLKLALSSATVPIREVNFEGEVGSVYVTVSDREIRKMTREFLGVEDTEGPRPSGEEEEGSGGSGKKRPKVELVDASAAGRDQAQQAEAEGARLPVLYPTRITPGSTFPEPPAVYKISIDDRKNAPAYRIVVSNGLVGEYYGVQGTSWKDAPILSSPTESRTIDGRDYDLHFDGDRLRRVSWEAKGAVYWVSNTLLQSLSEKEMLAIATSVRGL